MTTGRGHGDEGTEGAEGGRGPVEPADFRCRTAGVQSV